MDENLVAEGLFQLLLFLFSMVGIYKITSPSGRIYIGQSVDLEKREREYSKNHNCKNQRRLYASLIKYSFSKHIFEVVEQCSEDQLNVRERRWQDFYDVLSEEGLNCKLTGTKDCRVIHSEETKRRISEAKKGVPRTEETNRKISEARKGVSRTQETREKISEGNKGKRLSEESKERMRGKRGPHKNPAQRGPRGPYKKKIE